VQRSPFTVGMVGDICEEIQDGLHGVRHYVQEGIPLLGVGNVTEEGLDLREINRITPEEHVRLSRSQVSRGDVLVTITGRLGTAMVYASDEEANLSAHVARIRVKPDHNAGYLAAYFNSSIGRHFISLNEIGSTHPHINVNRLKDVTLVIPPRPIQDAIADKMDAAYQRKRELEAEAEALLESIDGYVLGELGREWGKPPDQGKPVGHEAVWFGTWRRDVRRLDPKRYRYQREGPPPKSMRRLGDLLARRLEKVDRSKYAFEDLQLVSLHFDGSMSERDVKAWRKDIKGTLWFAYPGDLVYSKIDARNGAIGLVPDELGRIAVTSEFPVYQVKEGISAEYLKIVLRTPQFTGLLQAMAAGHSGRKRIQPRELEDVLIPAPLLNQQRKIAAEVQARREQAQALKEEAERVVVEAKAEVERMILGEGEP
jgi:type I restriction enzyme S subunit